LSFEWNYFIDFEKEPLDNNFEVFQKVVQKVYPTKIEDVFSQKYSI